MCDDDGDADGYFLADEDFGKVNCEFLHACWDEDVDSINKICM